jgi:hypothetical protein
MKKLLGAVVVVGVVVSCGPMDMLPDGGSMGGGSAGGSSGTGGGAAGGSSAGGAAGGTAGGAAGGSAGGAAGGSAGGAAGGSAGGSAGGAAGGTAGGSAGGSAGSILFSSQVRPLLTTSCSGGSCHNVTAANAFQFATGTPSRNPCMGTASSRVVAGNAAGSLLFQKLSPSPACGSRMPLNRTPFTQAQLDLVRDWINQGAQNN